MSASFLEDVEFDTNEGISLREGVPIAGTPAATAAVVGTMLLAEAVNDG